MYLCKLLIIKINVWLLVLHLLFDVDLNKLPMLTMYGWSRGLPGLVKINLIEFLVLNAYK